MRPEVQHGFVLPEMLVALVVVGLAVSLVGSFASPRIDAEKMRAQQAEGRYLAALVERAYRRGLLAGNTATTADLQTALPHVAVPARLGGRDYRIALDGADPRILAEIEVGLSGGGSMTRTEVIRAPLPASELRLPFWRARRLREIREANK